MKNTILCVFSLVILFASTPVVFAQETVTGIAQLAGCSGVDCSACNVVYLANGGIKWLIGILFVVFALLLAIAGVKLVTSGGNHHALDEAKSSFTNAIIGFLIILSAWLIVDTIMRALVGGEGNEGEIAQIGTGGRVTGWLFWSNVQCQAQADAPFKDFSQDEIQYIEGYQEESYSDASYVVVNPSSGNSSGGGGATAGTGANCPAAAASSVVTIPGTNYKARQNIANSFVAMRAAAARDGITLTVTSGWRSEAVQVEIWNRHGCASRSCSGIVARPCTLGGNGSNHNSGNAVDISMGGGGVNTAIFRWLKANGGRYGFYNNLDSRDPFHWSPTGR